jgi:hypothetical protein
MNRASRRRSGLLPATLLVGAGAACAASLASCSGPSGSATVSYTFPDETQFKSLVSPALEIRCGTLDCHGSIYRNMRFFGKYGARLSSKDVTGLQDTTDDELQYNYGSLVSLEPENLGTIVAKHGQGFDKWMVVLKGTNSVYHKGGERMKKGDPTYTCLLSWVTGAVDMSACMDAAMPMAPMSMPSATAPTDGMPTDGTPPPSAPSQ